MMYRPRVDGPLWHATGPQPCLRGAVDYDSLKPGAQDEQMATSGVGAGCVCDGLISDQTPTPETLVTDLVARLTVTTDPDRQER